MLAVAAALGAIAGVAPAAQRRAAIHETLDAFERERTGGFRARTAAEIDQLREALERDANSWIAARGAEHSSRRRFVVATAALEAVAANEADWPPNRRLIAWASELLRKGGPPSEFERRWHLAALAIAQGVLDVEFLLNQREHSWVRFPKEPRFALADALIIEGNSWPDPIRSQPWDSDQTLLNTTRMAQSRRSQGLGVQPDMREKAFEHQRRTFMRAAIEQLELLANVDSLRAEALLRLGFLHLRLQDAETALEQFADVQETASEPFLLYLAHFFGGKAHERQSAPADAIASYRAALTVVPRAQSAATALAALLFLEDQRDEADAVVAAALTPPFASDPWRLYQAGDFRLLDVRLAAVREAIP